MAALKRKTQLNLSGSHHVLDADRGDIGGSLLVSGSVYTATGYTGSLHWVDTAGTVPFITATGMTANYNAPTGQWQFSYTNPTDLDAGWVSYVAGITTNSGSAYITGSLRASSLSASAGAQITGSLIAPQITGSIKFVDLSSTPFIVAGPNITASYNSLGQWAISASTVAPGGVDTNVQFNQNGTFAGSSNLTFTSGTLGVNTISGSNTTDTLVGAVGPNLLVNSPVVLTKSIAVFDGINATSGFGGVVMQQGGGVYVSSGAFGGNSQFSVAPSATAGQVDVSMTTPSLLVNGINIVPIYTHATTSVAAPSTLLSSSILTAGLPANGVGKFDLNVLAADSGAGNFASWTFVVTITSVGSSANVIGVTEVDTISTGAGAASWDVAINTDGTVGVTGSTTSTYWYAALTKKMILSTTPAISY